MILQNAVKRFALRGISGGGFRRDFHPRGNWSSAGPQKFSINFDHAGVASLDRAELRVVANLRQLGGGSIDHLNQELTGVCFLRQAVNRDRERRVSLLRQTTPSEPKFRYYGLKRRAPSHAGLIKSPESNQSKR
jgi:hypothetical protein